MKPGARTSPLPETTFSPGFGSSAPTSRISSPEIRTLLASRGLPVPSATCAPTMIQVEALDSGARVAARAATAAAIAPAKKSFFTAGILQAAPGHVRESRAHFDDVLAVLPGRRDLDEPLQGHARGFPVAVLPRHTSDVVESVVLLGVDLQALLPGFDGFFRVAKTSPGDAERIPGAS